MSWCVGVLTWNRHERCRETLRALEAGLDGEYGIIVYDNGSDVPFQDNGLRVVRAIDNLGAGAGMSQLVRHMLSTNSEFLLFTEDDWVLCRPLVLGSLEEVLSDHSVGQARLAVRSRVPSENYWTYGLEGEAAQRSLEQASCPFSTFPCGEYQLVRLLWSNNPWACRRDVAERFCLTGQHEIAMARPYLNSGLLTADVVPGYFLHAGRVHERRGEPGWKR